MRRGLALTGLALALAAAGWLYHGSRRPSGIVFISIDTLRADHLGAYGYPLDTSPFFDELAERGTLFENAIVQLPGTLPSHMSMFTGLYPAQHGVFPPDSVLPPDIATLPERFRAAGFRTAGFTEGGYASGHYGFARGFDVFADDTPAKPLGAARTFGLARDWIDTLSAGERFFLFIHTYEVHDPYRPAEPYLSNSWPGPPPEGAWEPTGPNLTAASKGHLPVTPKVVEYFAALYDASIRGLDDVLRGFVEHLWAAGLSRDTLVVVTSDHGEEFFEHGSFVHRQVYHETLHVPLLFRRLGQRRGARVADLVESVDLAPTLLEVAGIEVSDADFAGTSRAGLLGGGKASPEGNQAFAEAMSEPTRVVYRQLDSGLFAFLFTRVEAPRRAISVGRSITFDWTQPRVAFTVRSYGEPRDLAIYVDGQLQTIEPIVPDVRRDLVLDLPVDNRRSRVRLEVDGCSRAPGAAVDSECIGFLLEGLAPERRELYRLDDDPLSQVDLSALRPALVRDLEVALEENAWEVRATAGRQDLTDSQVEQLKALGYLQ